MMNYILALSIAFLFSAGTLEAGSKTWYLVKKEDPQVLRSIDIGTSKEFCINWDERVRVKIFRNRVRVFYRKMDARARCWTTGPGLTEVYVRAQRNKPGGTKVTLTW